jgi:two-component system OmpR family response regulator
MDDSARILVVEDEDNIRYVAVGALRNAGYEVSETSTGKDALTLVNTSNSSPDLIVLDVMLPDLDGFEVCKRMRSERLETPVVFLTARDATEDRIRGLTIGGDDYLTKPFSVEELVARVRVVLRRVGKTPHRDPVRVADLELDDDAHIVTKAGDVIALSPTEYKLLRFLMRNAGRALSRVASRGWCKSRLTRFLSIILRGGCNSLVDHLLIVLSVIGRDQLVPQVL